MVATLASALASPRIANVSPCRCDQHGRPAARQHLDSGAVQSRAHSLPLAHRADIHVAVAVSRKSTCGDAQSTSRTSVSEYRLAGSSKIDFDDWQNCCKRKAVGSYDVHLRSAGFALPAGNEITKP